MIDRWIDELLDAGGELSGRDDGKTEKAHRERGIA